MDVLENEQRLTDGICHLCRRKRYCAKPCTQAKRGATAMLDKLKSDPEELKKFIEGYNQFKAARAESTSTKEDKYDETETV